MEFVMWHEARQVPSWLIFDVRQKRTISPMTSQAKSDPAVRTDAIWIPFGFLLGTALGGYLAETALGMSLGLISGATVSTAIEYRQGKRSVVWPIVGGFAFVWIVFLFLIERT